MNYTNHLLSKYKILKSFNITKRITQSHLKKMAENLKKSDRLKKDLKGDIYNLIVSDNDKDLNIEEIPGIILNEHIDDETKNNVQDDFNNLPHEKQKIIIQLAATIINSSDQSNLNSLDIFFLIQIIFNELQISPSDMKKYNDKYSNSTSNQTDEDEDEYEDSDDDEEDDDDFKF